MVNCIRGKLCGKTCIRRRKRDGTPTTCTKPPMTWAGGPYHAVYPDGGAFVVKNCRKGKRCGATCIPKYRRDGVTKTRCRYNQRPCAAAA